MVETQAWKEVSRKQVFKKYSRKIEAIIFELPDGSIADFYIKAEGRAASIVAFTSDNQIILVKQYRPGPMQVLDELPGGYIEEGEDPLVAARREFIEESGYDGDFEFVSTCLDDAYSTMERYCYVAKNCQKVSEPLVTSSERTEVVLLSQIEFRERLRRGMMTDVEVGYICLDYLGLLSS